MLVTEDESRIASKAAHLAALIGGSTSSEVVALAAHSRHEAVRVPGAAAVDKLPPDSGAEIAPLLLSDPDARIRARAAKSAANVEDPRNRESLEAMAETDSHPDLCELAARLSAKF